MVFACLLEPVFYFLKYTVGLGFQGTDFQGDWPRAFSSG